MIFSVVRAGSSTKHDRYSTGFHHLALNADTREQVEAFHRLLVKNGVQVLDPPADYDFEPGYYAVFFSDPDGMKPTTCGRAIRQAPGYVKVVRDSGATVDQPETKAE